MTRCSGGLVRSIALLLSLLCLPAQGADNFRAELLAEHLYLITGPSGNTLVAVDTDALILVEGVPAEYAEEYLAFIKATAGDLPVSTLINTHWHPEATGLNGMLAAAGTDIVAHANTRQWLAATIRKRGDAIIHRPLPTEELPGTVFHNSLTLPFRGATIELGHLLQAHTDGDLYALFPAQNVLYTGPAVRTDAWSTVDESSNGFIGGLMDAYDTLAALIDVDTRIVPASGELVDKAAFDVQTAMYKDLMKAMVTLLRQSRSAQEVVSANPASGMMPEWGDASAFLDEGFRSFYGHLRNTRHVGAMP